MEFGLASPNEVTRILIVFAIADDPSTIPSPTLLLGLILFNHSGKYSPIVAS